ncbi:hypothetical protein KBD61_04140 [Patescibacteria group bacterium]|nr:hypothetical protein [Patescibacteria group bacterium]MBP9710186.1 hypothetical protein [Patescibacteria group bacterium]
MGTREQTRGDARRRWAIAIYRELHRLGTQDARGRLVLKAENPVKLVFEIADRLQRDNDVCRSWERVNGDEARTIFCRTMKAWVVKGDEGGYILVQDPSEFESTKKPFTPKAKASSPKKKRTRSKQKGTVQAPLPERPCARPRAYERPVVGPASEPPVSGRVEHGWLGAYMTPAEQRVWDHLVGQIPRQPIDGWGLSLSPALMFEALHLDLMQVDRDTLLEAIGRFCSAKLLKRTASNTLSWRIVHNPRNVRIKKIKRRWMVSAASTLLEESRLVRKSAEELRDPVHGLVNLGALFKRVGAKKEKAKDLLHKRFVLCDVQEAEIGGYGILMPCDDDACLYVPWSLAGRDFFPHKGRDRTELIEDTHPRHAGCVRGLQKHFRQLALTA